MIILGMDEAPKGIAWAFGEPGTVPTRGFYELNDYGDNTARLGGQVRKWATAFYKSIGAEEIYAETILRNRGWNFTTECKQWCVLNNLEASAEIIGIPDDFYVVTIGDWRRDFYAGVRPSKHCDEESAIWKDMAVKECARRNWFTDNHDVAEACGIWDHGCKQNDKLYRTRAKIDARRQQSKQDKARAEA